MSYEGLKSIFFDNSDKASEEDYNLAPSENDDNEENSCTSSKFRFRSAVPRSRTSDGGNPSVRFSHMSQSVSRSSVMKGGSSGEEKCEECSLPPSSYSSP